MTIPLWILAFGSLSAGFLGMPHGFHILPPYLQHYLDTSIVPWDEVSTPISEMGAMGIAVALAIIGMSSGFFIYRRGTAKAEALAKPLRPLQVLWENKYWIDELYGLVFVLPFEKLSKFFARFVDPRIIDGFILFPTRVARAGGTLLALVQNGAAQFYLFIMLAGTLAILWVTLKGLVIG